MNNKTTLIIQARMGSTRLPGKVMLNLFGHTVLAHDIERVKQAKQVDEIVVATTEKEADNPIVLEAKKYGVEVFRGSEEDVLSRYYLAAADCKADIVVRITSDCPLIDPQIIDEIVYLFKTKDYDIVTNAGIDPLNRTYPRGLDTEVFSFQVLKDAHEHAVEDYQREHVTPYIYENSNKIFYLKNDVNYSHLRWTLDTQEDWQFIYEVYKHLYRDKHDFYFKDIVRLLDSNPELSLINKNIKQKKIKEC